LGSFRARISEAAHRASARLPQPDTWSAATCRTAYTRPSTATRPATLLQAKSKSKSKTKTKYTAHSRFPFQHLILLVVPFREHLCQFSRGQLSLDFAFRLFRVKRFAFLEATKPHFHWVTRSGWGRIRSWIWLRRPDPQFGVPCRLCSLQFAV